MASSGLTFAGDAASIASNPSNPLSWAKLAGDVFGGLFDGGSYATNTQTHLVGSFDASGYHGTINSVTTAGEDPTADIPGQIEGINKLLLPYYKSLFGSKNVSIPIESSTPTGMREALNSLANIIKINAEKLNMESSPIAAIVGTTDPTGASANNAQPPAQNNQAPASAQSGAMTMTMPAPAIMAALMFVAARYL